MPEARGWLKPQPQSAKTRRSPWQLVARIIGLAPTVYAVRARRNIYLGMAVHCSLNTIGVLLVAAMVLARI
jgi:membrane protease YdiL (CAAX protease family)